MPGGCVAASLFTQGFRSVLIRPMRLGALMPVMLATACTTHSYMGISLVPGQASPELQDLAARAQGGDKQAQLDLGIRFEAGKEVAVDRGRAVRLYRQSDGRRLRGHDLRLYPFCREWNERKGCAHRDWAKTRRPTGGQTKSDGNRR